MSTGKLSMRVFQMLSGGKNAQTPPGVRVAVTVAVGVGVGRGVGERVGVAVAVAVGVSVGCGVGVVVAVGVGDRVGVGGVVDVAVGHGLLCPAMISGRYAELLGLLDRASGLVPAASTG